MKIGRIVLLTQHDGKHDAHLMCRVAAQLWSDDGKTMTHLMADCSKEEAQKSDCEDELIGGLEIALEKVIQELIDVVEKAS